MRNCWILATLLCCGTVSAADAKAIAFTFEKLPYMEPLGYYMPREVSMMVLRTLEGAGASAIGFVVEEKIEDRPETLVILQDWIDHGFLLGNNTYAYVDLNELRADDFLSHIRDGNKYIRKITHWIPGRPRYFRYPLLHEGNTPDKKKDVAKRLQKADFVLVPATVLASDFEFNFFMEQASSEPEFQERLKKLYLEHLGWSLDYAEKQSNAVFGRQIPQILGLHLGVATATFLPDLLELLKARGYQWISVPDALKDEAYRTEETYVGPLGLSFIDRVAATRGVAFDETNGSLSRREISEQLTGAQR